MRTSALDRPEAPLARAPFSASTTFTPRAASAYAMLAPFTPPPTTTTSSVWLIASPACWACYPSSAGSERHQTLRSVGRGGDDGLQSSIIQAFVPAVWMMLPDLHT